MKEERQELFAKPSPTQTGLWIGGIVMVLLLGWTLRAMAPVAIPVAFALVATLFIAPFDLWLKHRLPQKLAWLAHLLSVLTLLAILAIFIGSIIFAAQQVLSAAPDLSDQVSKLWKTANGDMGNSASGGLVGELQQIWRETGGTISGWAVDRATSMAQTSVTMTGAFATSAFLVLFIAFMGLSELGDWRGKFQALWSKSGQNAWSKSLQTISHRLQEFLLIRSFVGLLQAALYVGWLALFGIDLLLVWGVLTFLLTYIPTLGSIIAGTLPVLYALLVVDPWTALAIAAGLFVIEQLVGNYLDPILLGRRLLISPLVILIALLFWGWYWGIAGAFLATPVTLSLIILFNRIPPLRPVALLLSNQTSHDTLDEALNS